VLPHQRLRADLDGYSRIERIVNNFERISFNFGRRCSLGMEGYDRRL